MNFKYEKWLKSMTTQDGLMKKFAKEKVDYKLFKKKVSDSSI